METSNAKPAVGIQNGKPARFRSVAYPSNTISHCVDLTTRVNKIFGNLTYTSREALAKELEVSDSHLQGQLSSCVQYGLLDLKSKEGYKPTQLFTKIYRPLPTEKPIEALIESFQNPELYKVLINQYNGSDLPMPAGLATVLYRNHKVSEQASNLAAKIFIENAKELNLLNADNSFRIDNVSYPGVSQVEVIEFDEAGNDKIKETVTYLPPQQQQPSGLKQEFQEKQNPLLQKIPVLLDDGSIAEILLPNGIKRVDLERISKVITAYL